MVANGWPCVCVFFFLYIETHEWDPAWCVVFSACVCYYFYQHLSGCFVIKTIHSDLYARM